MYYFNMSVLNKSNEVGKNQYNNILNLQLDSSSLLRSNKKIYSNKI